MTFRSLLACCLIILISACKDKNDPDIIVNIEDDFYVNMFEDISNGERRLEFRLTSIKEQDCLNYSIDYNLSFNEGSGMLELSINDLVQPEICIEGNATASVTVPFGAMSNGTYTLFINLKDAITNHGRLSVDDLHYQLDLDSDDGIEITNETLYRVPQQTIWGAVAYNSNNQEDNADAVLNDLKDITIVRSIQSDNAYPSGYYGYFDLDESKSISLQVKPEAEYHKPFIFTVDGDDLTAINDLIEAACNQYPELNIELNMTNGQVQRCN